MNDRSDRNFRLWPRLAFAVACSMTNPAFGGPEVLAAGVQATANSQDRERVRRGKDAVCKREVGRSSRACFYLFSAYLDKETVNGNYRLAGTTVEVVGNFGGALSVTQVEPSPGKSSTFIQHEVVGPEVLVLIDVACDFTNGSSAAVTDYEIKYGSGETKAFSGPTIICQGLSDETLRQAALRREAEETAARDRAYREKKLDQERLDAAKLEAARQAADSAARVRKEAADKQCRSSKEYQRHLGLNMVAAGNAYIKNGDALLVAVDREAQHYGAVNYAAKMEAIDMKTYGALSRDIGIQRYREAGGDSPDPVLASKANRDPCAQAE
ncbi:hypothetical protein [Nevskia sp.]|uniref:hypothetical protein n=1 Tax=Nevskia sp. TaxID=1929292 RepID=UPI0025E15D78|nr:hypothetical protein [Nevskia sp.]